MSTVFSLAVPAIIALVTVHALCKKIDVFEALKDGAMDGLHIVYKILPALVALLTGVYMLRASGALDAFSTLCRPLFDLVGIPPETASMILIRPVSGSGALAVGSELIEKYGPDSTIGRTAAVMLGSTETTFYVIAVYFGAARYQKNNATHHPPLPLCAEFSRFSGRFDKPSGCFSIRLSYLSSHARDQKSIPNYRPFSQALSSAFVASQEQVVKTDCLLIIQRQCRTCNPEHPSS